MSRTSRNTLVLGSIFAALAVILGAFAAHGLEKLLEAKQLETFQTGVRYQFYHAFGLFVVGLLSLHTSNQDYKWAVICMSLGILLFSGSLYLLSTQSVLNISTSFLGPITPIGGALFIVSWILVIRNLVRSPLKNTP